MPDDQDLLKIAQTAIQEDPTISNPVNIITTVHKEGPIFRKKTVIKLDGTVSSAHEVDKVEKTVKRKLPEIEIQNNLVPA